VAHEVQSKARMNATNLETIKEAKEVLEIVLIEVLLECREDKRRTNRLEESLEEVF